MTERQTDITPEDPDLEKPDSEEPLEEGNTEVPDEPMGVPAEGESSVGDQPGIPEGEPPASE